MKKVWLLALLLLLSAPRAQAERAAWKAVWRSEAAPARVSLTGQVRTTVALAPFSGGKPRPRQATARVYAAQGKLRLDYESDSRRWSLLDDGRDLIQLRPSTRTARILPRPRLAVDRALAEKNYVARRAGADTVAGRPTDVIEIVPRRGGGPVWALWLDRATAFVLRRERHNIDGKLTTATEYLSVDFGARPSPGLFEIPAGYTRLDRDGQDERLSLAELQKRTGFSVHQPGYLPPGYVLLGGYYRHESRPPGARGRRGHPPRGTVLGAAAELRYTDGVRMLSVVQHAADGARPFRSKGGPGGSEVVARGSERVLRYRADGRVVVVVGDLTQSELLRVAKSVR